MLWCLLLVATHLGHIWVCVLKNMPHLEHIWVCVLIVDNYSVKLIRPFSIGLLSAEDIKVALVRIILDFRKLLFLKKIKRLQVVES